MEPEQIPSNCKMKAQRAFAACLLVCLATVGAGAGWAQTPGAAALTVQRLYSSPGLSGSLTRGIEWSPDSKEISYLQNNAAGEKELWTMDAATGAKKVLVKAETMAAVTQPEKTQGDSGDRAGTD